MKNIFIVINRVGKNFDRIGYLYMKKCIEKGDTLVIDELDRLGRNDDLRKEWQFYMDNEINVRVLNIPSLNLNYDDENIKPLAKMIRNLRELYLKVENKELSNEKAWSIARLSVRRSGIK